jgi:hypothetical protein
MPEAFENRFQRHKAQVARLSQPGGALTTSPHATTNNPDWYDPLGLTEERRATHHQLLSRSQDAAPDVGHGRQAIILAGPPGAGKGTIRQQVIRDTGIPPSSGGSSTPTTSRTTCCARP